MLDTTVEHNGRTYEVHLCYERLASDGGPGWVVEGVSPEPPNWDTFHDIATKAERIAAHEVSA